MNKQPKRDYSKQIEEAAISLAKKYDMSEDRARAIVTQRLNSLMHEQQQDNRGFFEKMGEYIYDTAAHPIDRLAQIGISSASTFPGMIDLSSRVYNPSLGEDKAQVFRGEDYLNPNYEKPTEENPRELLNLAGQTKEYLRTQGKKIGLNPEKNEFAENVNEVPAAILDMVLNRGAGTGIKAAGKAFRDAGKRAEVLGTTGKAAIENVGKGIEGVGNFFKAGTNIKNPAHVGANVGAVVAPKTIPDENRNIFTDIGASLAGANIGGRLPRSIFHLTPEARRFKAENKENYRSDAYQKNKMYEDIGVTAYPFNVTESVPVKLGTKVMETSILGQNVREALDKQKREVSKAIYPDYEQPFSRSEIAIEAQPHIMKEAENISEDFARRFNEHKADVEKYTDRKVVLNNVNQYVHDVLKGISNEPGHINMFLTSPLGQTLQQITGDTLGASLNKKLIDYEKNAVKSGLSPREVKELQELKAKIDSKPKKETVKINGVTVDIDPVLRKVMENPFLKQQMLIDNPHIKNNIDFSYAEAILRDIGEQNVFGKYFKKKDSAEMAGLYGALKEDVNQNIIQPMSLKDKKAAERMRRNYADYAEFAQKERPDFNAMMNNIEDPLKLANLLVGDVQKRGSKKNLFAQNMNPEDYNRFVGKVNRMLGSANKANNAEFNPSIWNKNFKNMDEIVKNNIYGKDLKRYEAISNVIDDMNKVHKFENTSGTALHTKSYGEGLTYASALASAASDLFTGDWKIALAKISPILGVKGIDIGLTNQAAKKLIIKMQNLRKLNEAVDTVYGLSKLSHSDKVKVMLKNLGKSLSLMKENDNR
jgi:hypothetical protein